MRAAIRWNLSDKGWAIMGERWSFETQSRQFSEHMAKVDAKLAKRRAAGKTTADDIFDALHALKRKP